MKKIIYLAFLGLGFLGFAQNSEVPEFYKEMKSASPNLNKVEELYEKYRRETPDTFSEKEIKEIQAMKAKSKNERSSWLSSVKKETTSIKKEFRDEYEKQYIDWRKSIQSYIQADGSIVYPTEEEIAKNFHRVTKDTPTNTNVRKKISTSENRAMAISAGAANRYGSATTPYHSTFSGWRYFGIINLLHGNGQGMKPSQANVRAFAQSQSNPNVVVCAVESGTIYISHNKGQMWHMATIGYNIKNITALAISPNDENIIYAAGGGRYYVTRDGGITWTDITVSSEYNTFQDYNAPHGGGGDTSKIVVASTDGNPLNDIVLYSTKKGLLKLIQTQNGTSVNYRFQKKLEKHTTDIIKRTGRNEFFALGYDTTKRHNYFYSSTDGGETWQRKGVGNGWFEPEQPMHDFWGGRIAMSPNDENIVYAYLIENRVEGDNGFLGVYRSADGGENWTLPNPNGPGKGANGYSITNNNPNLVTFPWGETQQGYHQGFYNCAIIVNPSNVDDIIVGGLNAWRSINGGRTFQYFGGYYGPFSPFHPDMQTFYQQKNDDGSVDSWLTTDGGINYSNTFFDNNTTEIRTAGLGSDYWGFDLGEYNTTMGGGMYHNGNNYYVHTYPSGTFKNAGGGENSTGYIFPDEDERHMYFSDVGGIIASKDLNTSHTSAPGLNPTPTEPYAGGDTDYTQRDFRGNTYYYVRERVNNQNTGKISLYRFNRSDKTTTLIKEHNFPAGTSIDKYMVSFSHPRYQYIIIWHSNTGNRIYATEDGGITWEERGKPFDQNIVIALSDKDPNTFYALRRYQNGNNMLKKTTDGGRTYTNVSNPNTSLNYRHILNVRGTDVIFLFGNSESSVYYRLNDNDTWKEYSQDLPPNLNVLEPKIQYRAGEFYMATSGAGIWTRKLPDDVLAQMDAIKMNIEAPVKVSYAKEFQFKPNDISLYHGKRIISRVWDFPGADQVLNADTDKPTVIYNKFGRFPVKLTLTDDRGKTYSQTFPDYFTVYPFCACDIPNALKNNLGSINVWVDASKINAIDKSVIDKATGTKYNIVGNNWQVFQDANQFNGQKVFQAKGDHNYIDLLKEYEGQTIFVVSKLNTVGNNMAFSFLLGSATNADFHSDGRVSPIFSGWWGEPKNIFRGNGVVTSINNVAKNFFSTGFVTDNLAVYSLRVGEGKTSAKVRYLSKDRGQNYRTWLGEIAEVIVINKRLTDAEITEINQHLMTKYGIQ